LFQKRIYSIFLGTLVGKRKQTILKKRWFDITSTVLTEIIYYDHEPRACIQND
jgi:hypothetical protein